MTGVPIYAQDCTDFSTNGLGLVFPTECTVSETINAEYELHMVLPISDDGKWQRVVNGCYVKALCPVREVPDADVDLEPGETATQDVYAVSGVALAPLYRGMSTSGVIMDRLSRGTEVVELDAVNTTWKRVSVVNGGETGYMLASQLVMSRSVTIDTDGGTAVNISKPRPQLFRVYSTSVDVDQGEVTYEAMHIFYDLRGNIIADEFEVSEESAATVADKCFGKLLNANPFTLYSARLSKNISAEYNYNTFVEVLLDESTGIVPQADGFVLRDNWDVYLLKDEERNRHVTIRRGKNAVGLTVNSDDSEVITRIIPCGQTKDGDPLFLTPTKYVDSEHIDEYPVIHAQKIDYDVKVGDNYKDATSARAALQRMAMNDYAAGCDVPKYGMEIDFVTLLDPDGGSIEALQGVHLNDSVTVLDEVIGLTARIRMTSYTWDVLMERYSKITLGDFDTAKIRFWGNANISGTGYAVQRPLEAMTANSSRDCVASASSTYSSSYAPWKAFDYSTKSSWASARDGAAERWIQLQMDMPLENLSIAVYSRGSKDHCPTAGRVMGSNDGATWVQLATYSWTAKASALLGTISCANDTAYSYVRLVVTDSYGSGSYVAVGYIAVTGNVSEEEEVV